MRADHQHHRVLVVPGRAEQAAIHRLLLAVDGGNGQRLAAVADFAGGRLGLGVDEQTVEAAGLAQRFERRVAGPFEEGAIGVHQRVEAIDQDADRQPVEDRPPFLDIAGGVAAHGARRGARLARDIVRRRRVLAGGALEPAAEFAREFLKGAALAGAELRRLFGRRRSERQYIGRWGLGFDLGWRGRRLCPALLERGQALDVAADSKAAITGKLAVAVEHRQPRHFDRQRFVRVVDRPRQHDAAPGAARGERARHGSLRIEFERGGDLGPRAVEHGRGLAAEQLREFILLENEAVGGVDLPDETERKAARVGFRRGRFGARGLLGRGECYEERHRRAGAEAEHRYGPGRDVAFGAAVERCFAREPLGAERDQVEFIAKSFARRRHGFDQLAIGGKNCRRPVEIREQPLRAMGRPRALPARSVAITRTAGRIVGQHDARAKTGQRAAEAGAETAQPFEPRRAALRQRAGKPRDLRGDRMLGREADGGERPRRVGVEDRGGDRVGPQNAGGVRAPQPYRVRAQGVGREPRIGQASELEIGRAHRLRRKVYS